MYFEAGYAERVVPVIYTCRRDHFSPKESDKDGNLRVHFDLKMRNIVSWKNPQDSSFVERVSRRIRKTIRPLQLQQEAEKKERVQAEKFMALSKREKFGRLLDIVTAKARRAGFSNVDGSWLSGRRGLLHGWMGNNRRGKIPRVVYFHLPSSLTKSSTADFRDAFLYRLPHEDFGQLRRFEEYALFCSLKRVPMDRLTDVLSSYGVDASKKRLAWAGLAPTWGGPKTVVNRKTVIRVIDEIASEQDFEGRLQEVFIQEKLAPHRSARTKRQKK